MGIPSDQLKLVLEPEAAAVQCRHTLACGVRRDDGSLEIQPLPVGHEYILADLGGKIKVTILTLHIHVSHCHKFL